MRTSTYQTPWLPARLRCAHPALSAAAVLAFSYVVLLAILSGAGLIVTHLLAHSVGRWDDHVNAWFVGQRTATGNRVTGDFTLLANAPGTIGVAVLVAIVTIVRGRGRLAALLVVGLVTELAVFLSSNYIVARPRPHVSHLGSTPSTYSWPSGHVAATFVLYGGTAVIVTLVTRRALPRILAWSVAGLITGCVAVSRMYRGDHHPTDAMAGFVLGVGALCAAGLVCRAWAISSAHRRDRDEVRDLSTPAAPGGDHPLDRPDPAPPEPQPVGQA